ncbi:DUF262 domain-containing protein [Tersicoccus sp. MR15.9]|uniref:DUF262 domain-containing protein n=1 Tax=Tersicoccus mangrovi TaxID=3121635 RepID=UPI002FE5DDB7
MTDQPRRPSGQFDAVAHAEPDLSLAGQPAQPLDHTEIASAATSIGELVNLDADGAVDADPPYQRGHVWGEDRQRALVASILRGWPVGAIILNDRLTASRTAGADFEDRDPTAFAVVDGKQRLNALARFVSGRLAVPAVWFPAEQIAATPHRLGPDQVVTFRELSAPAQRSFRRMAVPVATATLPTLAQEAELFEAVNTGGVPQGETDADPA